LWKIKHESYESDGHFQTLPYVATKVRGRNDSVATNRVAGLQGLPCPVFPCSFHTRISLGPRVESPSQDRSIVTIVCSFSSSPNYPKHKEVGLLVLTSLLISIVCEDGGAHLRALRLSTHSEEQLDDAHPVAQWKEAVCM
jgi:hypothetical protein